MAFLIVAGLVVFVWITVDLPSARAGPQTTHLYARNGKLLTPLRGRVNRTPIPLKKMPRHLRQAVIAAEDDGFYSHPGVSLLSIVRAAWANVLKQDIEQGASTITQQYVRNQLGLRLGTEQTLERKAKEAILAMKLEREIDKDEILELYLNSAYLGEGSYGVEAAAQTYFAKPAAELSLLQSATIAGVIPRPEAYEPIDNPERSKGRRNFVLGRMAALGFITKDKADKLMKKPVRIKKPQIGYGSSPAAWFIDYAKRYLLNEFGNDMIFRGGLNVRTTVDLRWQQAAERAINTHLGFEGAPDAVLVAVDPANGAIRTVASTEDYSPNPKQRGFDPATFGCPLSGCDPGQTTGGTGRQTGSAFKMFTLAAAVHDGISLRSTFNGPGEITIPDPECNTGTEQWSPSNYSDSSEGTMDLISATAGSVNTIFAQLIAEVGVDKVVTMAHRLGIQSNLPSVCSLTLGTGEVSVLEMANAFATLASGGVRHDASPVERIRDPEGEVVSKIGRKGKRVLPANEAHQVVYALKSVVSGGTGTAASIGLDQYGKTGTSEEHANAWFCGGTTALVACVWLGHYEGNQPTGYTGGSVPAAIWHDFMLFAHQSLDAGTFPVPDLLGRLVEGSGIAPSPSPSPEKKEKPGGGPPEEAPPPDPEPEPEPSPSPSPSPDECPVPPCP